MPRLASDPGAGIAWAHADTSSCSFSLTVHEDMGILNFDKKLAETRQNVDGGPSQMFDEAQGKNRAYPSTKARRTRLMNTLVDGCIGGMNVASVIRDRG